MKNQSSVTRRQFIKVSLGAGTGLILGTGLAGCKELGTPASGVSTQNQATGFKPNVYLAIDSNNAIVITVPKTEMGQGVRTALPMIVAEELDANWSTIQVETAPADQAYGNQETGGSTSIDTFWNPLRQAGAVARAMLITAAAQLWQVKASTCTTSKGYVIHQESDRQLSYGELAKFAATLPVPDPTTIPLKNPKNFQLVGQSLKRVDDPQFVDGTAIFGVDVSIPNMLYATVARSPVLGGNLNGFDASKAKAVDGVQTVVEINNAVAVVANSTWAAIQGRRQLDVTWNEGEYATLGSEGIRQEILAQLPSGVAIGNDNANPHEKGTLDVLYEMPNLAHAPMEPMNCVADFRSNSCEVWAPTQNPQLAQLSIFSSFNQGRLDKLIRPFTGWSLDKIKVNVPLMGGGFGRRLHVDYVVEAVQVSEAINGPVQVVWTREDDIQHDMYHPLSYHHLSAALDPQVTPERKSFNGPEIIPHGAWRSVQHFTRAYVEECFVDELAAALNIDPYTLRTQRYDDPRLKNVLQTAAEKADWGSPLPAGWGRGIAAYKTWGKSPTANVVELSVADGGQIKVHRVVSVIDCGIVINPDMVKAQIEGGIVFALTAALKSNVTIENGRIIQSNFHDYPILRMDEMPLIEVYIVPGNKNPTGVGEMSGPPLTPAVANAVFSATGKRVRHIPIQAKDLL